MAQAGGLPGALPAQSVVAGDLCTPARCAAGEPRWNFSAAFGSSPSTIEKAPAEPLGQGCKPLT